MYLFSLTFVRQAGDSVGFFSTRISLHDGNRFLRGVPGRRYVPPCEMNAIEKPKVTCVAPIKILKLFQSSTGYLFPECITRSEGKMRTSLPPTPSHSAAGHSNTPVNTWIYAVRRINCNKGSARYINSPEDHLLSSLRVFGPTAIWIATR